MDQEKKPPKVYPAYVVPAGWIKAVIDLLRAAPIPMDTVVPLLDATNHFPGLGPKDLKPEDPEPKKPDPEDPQ